MKKKLMALMLAFALTATLAACGNKDDDTTTTTTQSSSEESKSEKADKAEDKSSSTEKAGSGNKSESSQKGKTLADATDDEDIADYHVKINNAVVSSDDDGNPLLIVHFDFTNNSDEAESAFYGISTFEAFQNGVECDYVSYAYNHPDFNTDNTDSKIQPGNTMNDCQIGFKLKDTTSQVEVDFYAYDDDYNKCYVKKTFALE